jgi:hypothetical protein
LLLNIMPLTKFLLQDKFRTMVKRGEIEEVM